MKKQARTEKDSGEKQEEERAAHKGRQEKGTSDEWDNQKRAGLCIKRETRTKQVEENSGYSDSKLSAAGFRGKWNLRQSKIKWLEVVFFPFKSPDLSQQVKLFFQSHFWNCTRYKNGWPNCCNTDWPALDRMLKKIKYGQGEASRKFLLITADTAIRHKNLTSSLMCSTCSSRSSFLSVSDLFFFNSDWPIRAANSKSRSFCEALRKES